MNPILYGSFGLSLLVILIIVHFRLRTIYSAAVFFVMAFVLAWWLLLMTFDNQVTLRGVGWPRTEQSYIYSINILMGFCVAYLIGRMLPQFANRFLLGNKSTTSASWKAATFTLPPKTIFALLAPTLAVFFVLTADGWWIFAPYPTNKSIWALVDITQAGLISAVISMMVLQSALKCGGWRRKWAFLWILLATTHFTLAGDRASLFFSVLGFFAILYFAGTGRQRRRYRYLGAVLLIPFFLLLRNISTWRGAYFYSQQAEFSTRFSFLDWIENLPNVPKLLADTSVTIEIVERSGTYFGGAMEFIWTMLLQIVPGPILSIFGVRLYNGPFSLMEFHAHGGGFFVPAELFFVAGFYGVLFIGMYLGLIGAFSDAIWRKVLSRGIMNSVGNPVFLAVVLATTTLPRSALYGMQTWHRMATLPIMLFIAVSLFRYFASRKNRRAGVTSPLHSNASSPDTGRKWPR